METFGIQVELEVDLNMKTWNDRPICLFSCFLFGILFALKADVLWFFLKNWLDKSNLSFFLFLFGILFSKNCHQENEMNWSTNEILRKTKNMRIIASCCFVFSKIYSFLPSFGSVTIAIWCLWNKLKHPMPKKVHRRKNGDDIWSLYIMMA